MSGLVVSMVRSHFLEVIHSVSFKGLCFPETGDLLFKEKEIRLLKLFYILQSKSPFASENLGFNLYRMMEIFIFMYSSAPQAE